MKTQKYYIKKNFAATLVLFTLVFSINVSAQETNDVRQKILTGKIAEFLGKYQQYGQFSVDGNSLDQGYIKEFSLLFDKNKFKGIYNDLASIGGSRFILPSDYVAFVRAHYPQGVEQSLELENLSIVESPSKNGFFRIIVKVKKQLTGMFDGKKIYSFNDDLFFFITVSETDLENTSGYKISGILSKEMYSLFIASRKSKGIYLGVSGVYEKTRIFSSSVYSSSIWKPKMGSSINPNVDITIMLANGFGLGTGFHMSNYVTSFDIENYNQTSIAKVTDIDGDTYNPVLQISSLTESNTIKCYEFPFLVKTRAGKGGTKLYFDFGIVYSMISKSFFTLDGSSIIKGYYPQYNVTLKNLPEYGFGTFNYSPSTTIEMKLTEQLISAQVALGLSFNIGKSLLLRVGARMNYGLTDIGFKKVRHSNDFNITLADPIGSTVLQSAGVELGLSYKIF